MSDTINGWFGDRYHRDGVKTHWFRARFGRENRSPIEFNSTNDEKNERHPVLDIYQFAVEKLARREARDLKAQWGSRASVRVHKRIIKVDSIALIRWVVIVRKAAALNPEVA
jgi:hypothetical protein